jgi:5'-deoxynucleotidase YfbR-like HD superfamily hydrolase/CYTH domain-containing protein
MSVEQGHSLSAEPATVQIERRYRLLFPEDIPSEVVEGRPVCEIQQCFSLDEQEREVRVRELIRPDGSAKYTRTRKEGGGIQRQVFQTDTQESDFQASWADSGRRIIKTRRYMPGNNDGETVEMDNYLGELAFLTIASIKFGQLAVAQSFEPTDWMHQAACFEVTDIPGYRDLYLSRYRDVGEVYKKELREHKERRAGAKDPYLSDERVAADIVTYLRSLTGLYGNLRTIDRQIFGNKRGHAPQETDAEHTYHLAFMVDSLLRRREDFGIALDDNFSAAQALWFALTHELSEIWATDTDAQTQDPRLLASKSKREHEGLGIMLASDPSLGREALGAFLYEKKISPEARLVSDLDKIAGILMIIRDNGRKWREQYGNAITIEQHRDIVGKKILTPLGKAIWVALDSYLVQNPQLFAPAVLMPEMPSF